MKTDKFYIVLLSMSLLIFSAALLITEFRSPKLAEAATCVKLPLGFGGMYAQSTNATLNVGNPSNAGAFSCPSPYSATKIGTFASAIVGTTIDVYFCSN